MSHLTRLAAGAATLTVVALGHTAGASAALPKTCLKDGVCFTKTFKGANTKITITGTAGNDKIVLSEVVPFGNNSLPTFGLDGKDTHVSANARLELAVNALAGDDSITSTFPPSKSFVLYGTSTLDGGDGNDVITAGERKDVLLGGAGNDTLFARDGASDVLDGGLGTDVAQADPAGIDTIAGVETIDAGNVVGRLQLAPHALRARAGETTHLNMSWTHPRDWRDLRDVAVRFYSGAKKVGMINLRPSSKRLTAAGAIKLASGSHVRRHGRTVKADLAMRLAPSLAGQDLRVEVYATDRHGQTQLVTDAGRVRVAA